MKIAIGIPTGGIMTARTSLSIIETIRLNPFDFFPIFSHGNFAATNKEKIVKIVKEHNCTHLLLVDCDMQFSPNALPALLDHNKDIVGVHYNYRKLPKETVTKFFDDKRPEKLFKVAGIGTGFLLIKMSVFEKLSKPYFPMEWDNDGNFILTEDIGFSEKARKVGFNIWCDPNIIIKHLGEYAY